MPATSCCGCFSLKTGVYVIGSLGLFSTITVLFIMLSLPKESTFTGYSNDERYLNDMVKRWTKGLKVGIITTEVLHLIICALLITGAFFEIAAFMVPWLCSTFSQILGMIPLTFGAIAMSDADPVLVLILPICFMALLAYFWWVVQGYCLELTKNSKPDTAVLISDLGDSNSAIA